MVASRDLQSLTLRSATSDDIEFLMRTFLASLRESIEAARGSWNEPRVLSAVWV